MGEYVCKSLESARGAGHDALRLGLVNGKQRDHKITDGPGADDLVGADDRERHCPGTEHIHRRSVGTARCARHIQPMSGVDIVDLTGIQPAELSRWYPVELQSH